MHCPLTTSCVLTLISLSSVLHNAVYASSTFAAVVPPAPDNTRKMTSLSRRAIFAAGTVTTLGSLSEIYSRGFPRIGASPSAGGDSYPTVSPGGTLTVVFHGAGGPDDYTAELTKRLRRKGYAVYFPDWTEYSGNTLRAAHDGMAIGRQVGRDVAARAAAAGGGGPAAVHVIGISVGAFPAQAVIDELTKLSGRQGGLVRPFLQATFLDPFLARGLYEWGYGIDRFGLRADAAVQYLNTDDPVPFTNQPLSNCRTVDVTSLRPENIFGHDWPLVYYSMSDEVGKIYYDKTS